MYCRNSNMVATHVEVSQSLNKPRIESSNNSPAEGLSRKEEDSEKPAVLGGAAKISAEC
jgi:hypothetical protein